MPEPDRRGRRRRTAGTCRAPSPALGLLVAGCAEDAPQDTWQPAGDERPEDPEPAVAGVRHRRHRRASSSSAAVGCCVFRFRDRGQPIPKQTHGRPALEIGLTILPALILIGVAIPTVGTLLALAKTDDTECFVNVTGQQWWWEIDYPVQEGCGGIDRPIVTSGQIVIPTGTNVLVRGTSRDVIHCFWIPRLNGKRDMVPGPGPDAAPAGRRARHLRRPVHRVLRAVPRQHAHGGRRPRPGRLRDVEGQPARAVHRARGGHAGRRGRGDVHRPVLALPPGRRPRRTPTASPVIAQPETYVYSGAAPNLTHLMTRNTFAGATFDLLTEACRDGCGRPRRRSSARSTWRASRRSA